MKVSDLIDVLNNFDGDMKVFVGPKCDDCVEAQQVNLNVSHYLDAAGVLVEDGSLCIISEKR